MLPALRGASAAPRPRPNVAEFYRRDDQDLIYSLVKGYWPTEAGEIAAGPALLDLARAQDGRPGRSGPATSGRGRPEREERIALAFAPAQNGQFLEWAPRGRVTTEALFDTVAMTHHMECVAILEPIRDDA